MIEKVHSVLQKTEEMLHSVLQKTVRTGSILLAIEKGYFVVPAMETLCLAAQTEGACLAMMMACQTCLALQIVEKAWSTIEIGQKTCSAG